MQAVQGVDLVRVEVRHRLGDEADYRDADDEEVEHVPRALDVRVRHEDETHRNDLVRGRGRGRVMGRVKGRDRVMGRVMGRVRVGLSNNDRGRGRGSGRERERGRASGFGFGLSSG